MHLALVLQAGGATTGVLRLIASAGLLAQVVLLILAIFSVVSWAVIIDRWLLFRKADAQSDEFLETFRGSQKFSQARSAAEELDSSPLSGVFLAGYAELASQMETAKTSGDNPGHEPVIHLANLERALRRASHTERRRLQRMMMFLATTAAVTPFIGLFGTVWGIMDAFASIGAYGTADLAVVGPGISAALTTTAAGLAAAIPAVIAYNALGGRIRGLSTRMQDFGLEFLSLIERNFRTRD